MKCDQMLFVIYWGPSQNKLCGPPLQLFNQDKVSDEVGPPDGGAISEFRLNECQVKRFVCLNTVAYRKAAMDDLEKSISCRYYFGVVS